MAFVLCSSSVAAAQTVYSSRVRTSQLNRALVPVWTDAQILTQFQLIRDTRYLHEGGDTSTPSRRIAWLYPGGGCETRADLAIYLILSNGTAPSTPYKVWAFDDNDTQLMLETRYDSSGSVTWSSHVAPVVKDVRGNLIVLDPAFSPCRPLELTEWLGMMAPNNLPAQTFDDPASGYRVALSDNKARLVSDPAFNDPQAGTHLALSLDWAQSATGHLYQERQNLLSLSWTTPSTVSSMLGSSPPWGNGACVTADPVYKVMSVAANSSASVVASCPFGTLAVGGGLMLEWSAPLVTKNAKTDTNGWEIGVRNTTSSPTSVIASAICLSGAPINAAVTTATGSTITLANNAYQSPTSTCSTGILVGGGFSTSVAGTPASIARIYMSGRTSSAGNTWRVSAYNTTGSNRTVTPYAYCLTNTNFSTSQTSATLSAEGIANAGCAAPLRTLGGGFSFPRTSSYFVATMDQQGSAYAVDMLPGPGATDPSAVGYAECLSVP